MSPRLVSSPRDGNDADTSARARADDVRASDHAAVLDQPDRVTEEARAALAEADADADSHEIDELQATDIIDDPDIGSDYGDGVLDLLPLSASSALPPPSSTTASARGGRAVGAVAQQPAAADASVPGDARLSVPIPVDIDLSTDDDLLRSDAQHTGELEPAAAAASRRPLMPAELTRHALEARWARMSEGVSIVKVPFGGFAKPSKRVLVLDVGSAQLRWGSSRTSLSSSLNLPTVTGVAVGVASEVFSRAPKSVVAQPELCCTISSLAGRTLDIVFETVDTAVEWYAMSRVCMRATDCRLT